MSQITAFSSGGGGAGTVETLTGNTGGAVSPNGSGNINVVGDGTTIDVVGNPGTNTLTISATTGAGSLILIQTQTASNSASLTFTTGITPTYNNYLLTYTNVFPVTGGADIGLQISTNGGSTYINSGYASGLPVLVYSTGATGAYTNATYMLLGASLRNFAIALNGTVYLQNFTSGSATGWPALTGTVNQQETGGAYFAGFPVSTYETGSTVINAFKIFASTGNIAQGTFSLYAIAQ